MSDNALRELREYMSDPIIESECGSVENFAQNVIDWTDRVNTLALRVRDNLEGPDADPDAGLPTAADVRGLFLDNFEGGNQ